MKTRSEVLAEDKENRAKNRATVDNFQNPTFYGGRRGQRMAQDMLTRTVKDVDLRDGNRHSKRAARARRRPYIRMLAKILGRGLGDGFQALKGLAES